MTSNTRTFNEIPCTTEFECLVTQAAAGDNDARGQIIERVRPRVENFAKGLIERKYSWLVHPNEMDEIVDDGLLAAFDAVKSETTVNGFVALAATIIRRDLCDKCRKQERVPAVHASELFDALAKEVTGTNTHYLRELAGKVFVTLSEEQQLVIMLRLEDSLGFSEIGELLGISRDAATKRYHYALGVLGTRFRERLRAEGH